MSEQADNPAAGNFLPNFCSLRRAFVVVVSAELLAVVLAFASDEPLAGFWPTLALRSLYVQWVAVLATVLLCALRGALAGRPHALAGLIAWAVITLTAAAVALAAVRLVPQAEPFDQAEFVVRSVAVAAIVAALLLRYLYHVHRQQERGLAASRARFEALQARIRPHFLFNSMNTIAELTRSDPVLAEELVQDLADLFRVSLGDAGSTSLERELDLARRYLHLEQQRLGERLRVEWDLRDLPLEARLPPLVLQPLLENAVYHGVEPAIEPGPIRIAGRYRKHQVNFSIRNQVPDGAGGEHRQGNRMALDNVRQRLEAHFQGRASLVASIVEDDYQIRLAFPHPWFEPGAG